MLQKVGGNNEENSFSWASAKGRFLPQQDLFCSYVVLSFVSPHSSLAEHRRVSTKLRTSGAWALATKLIPPLSFTAQKLSSDTSCPVPLSQHLSLESPLRKNATLLYKSGPKQELVWKHIINSPGRDLSPKPIAITDNIGQRTSQRWSFREGRRRWHHRSPLKLNADEYWDVTMFSNP